MRYGLIGEKLGHSFSKEIHERLADYTYDLIPLAKDELDTFMTQRDFTSINVTIPYKKDVMAYLDEVDDNAKVIGAVNTIVHKDGKLIGHNTDFSGFLYMVRRHNVTLKDKKVLIIGNGGAASAIQAVVKHEHAKEMVIVDILPGNGAITYEECLQHHLDAHVIINTSPVGMYPHIGNSPIDLAKFPSCAAVMDVVYNPFLTKFCLDAKELGKKHVNGLEMLIAQAKYAVEFFLDTTIDDAVIDEIYHDLLIKTCNIVLIGMPSAGKTTIGNLLAEKLQKEFIDLDDKIIERAGMSIPDIFTTSGEEGFRNIETEVTKELSGFNNKVIATGGGTIKRKVNMDYLSLNGITIFIDRDIEKLISTDPNRPLSKSKEALQAMHQERLPLYQHYAVHTAMNNDDIQESVEDIVCAYGNILSMSKRG